MSGRAERLILIMAKCPELGKVKTRLAKDVGEEKALECYRRLLRKNLYESSEVSADVVVFFTNDYDISMADELGFEVQYQSGEDLGERMLNAFWWAFEKGYQNVVMMGTDCYHLDEPRLTKALKTLQLHDLVLGPANDGGYYLIGMNEMHEALFQGIPWSTADVLLQTQASAQRLNLSFHSLDTLVDIDNLSDAKEAGVTHELGLNGND